MISVIIFKYVIYIFGLLILCDSIFVLINNLLYIVIVYIVYNSCYNVINKFLIGIIFVNSLLSLISYSFINLVYICNFSVFVVVIFGLLLISLLLLNINIIGDNYIYGHSFDVGN